MSTSEEEASFDSYDNEQINECNENEEYPFGNYFCSEEDDDHARPSRMFLYPRWKNVPRSPGDFEPSKTSISSCHDSDYQKWLEEYYDDIVKHEVPSYADKQCDTSDLNAGEKSKGFIQPIFSSVRKDPWTESTKYWGPKDVRRHWPLKKSQREYLFFPCIYPDLNLRTRHGRYQSMIYTASAVPEIEHRDAVCRMVKKNVESLLVHKPKLLKIFNCDNLCNLKWFDPMTRKAVLRCLCKFLKTQYWLEIVSLENAKLQRLEALIILCALSRGAGDTIKELHIWKMFDLGQNPLLLNYLPVKRNSSATRNPSESFAPMHYLQILYNFSSLTRLSVNYAYLANADGDALLCVKSLRTGCLKELRLLCTHEERPLLTNPGHGVGGCLIADGVWKRAAELCPDMKVKFAFMNLPQYDNIILFLSKNIPLTHLYIGSGKDFEFEIGNWEVDMTLSVIQKWYSNTLESLSLHLWINRDLLDCLLKRRILDDFPNLINFEFIGILQDVETLDFFCSRLCTGTYKLKKFLFWVEDLYLEKEKMMKTRKRVVEIRENYRRKFQVLDIDADIRTYVL